jgi:hypothetical protein
MPPTYEQNKVHIYNYRAKNPMKIKEIVKKAEAKRLLWLKGKREFLGILRRFFEED